MSLHINRFIDSVKAHEARGQRDFMMPMRDAKDLHADITKLLLTCQILQERLDQRAQQPVTIELSGGTFKSD
jgi:hypothetical protein